MSNYKSDFLNILDRRGFIYQGSDLEGLDAKLASERVSAYIGFDATARSLHVGNLAQIMMLYWFQACGHQPITLMGGGTSKIGDPSGKDSQRKLLSDDEIEANITGLKGVFGKFLDYEARDYAAIMVNNNDWLADLNYLSFLRDYGRHFTINRMLSFESVKTRLDREQPMTFLEFNYMILQAYDFLELYRRYGVALQMGGSDQWGNIVNGTELIRRVEGAATYAMTCPLLTSASGHKMGKTAEGAVWLNADMCSPYDYYQYWRNCEDADIGKLLRIFTTLPLPEIEELEQLEGRELNEAKKKLAYEATQLCHGEDAAQSAEETARQTFEQGGAGSDLPTLDIEESALAEGIGFLDAAVQLGLAGSKGEARRTVKQGGARINDTRIDDPDYAITATDLQHGVVKISTSKKKHALIRVI